jgi:hypothetical protein
MSNIGKQTTRLQKIENCQLVITNALSAMAMMGGAVPRNPDRLVELSNEIHDAAVELQKQSRKWAKKLKKEVHA